MRVEHCCVLIGYDDVTAKDRCGRISDSVPRPLCDHWLFQKCKHLPQALYSLGRAPWAAQRLANSHSFFDLKLMTARNYLLAKILFAQFSNRVGLSTACWP